MSKIKKVIRRVTPKNVANTKVAVLCLIAAATFWVLNALNKDNYTTVVDYPILFLYNQEEFMPVKKLPSSIKIEVNGNGWDLFRKYFQVNQTPFIIELSDPSARNFILTSEIRRNLSESISPTSLVSAVQDSIHFQIDRITKARVKIELDQGENFLAKNYRLDGQISISLRLIEVRGPTSILEQLNGTLLIRISEDKIARDYNRIMPLLIPEPYREFLTLLDESVQIRFQVYEMLEGTKRLNLELANFPANAFLVQEPRYVMLSYKVDERRLEDLNSTALEAVVNYNARDRSDSTVQVELNPKINFLEDIQLEPAQLRIRYRNE
ncbi:hypothetical protein A3SI_01971 [Nitritalea halalkaliphila LW7]|uniref:YbbR family protein n=1 Tax=Nitritalea halalkaliphila LW7 TaxID=1189621 RepID=I5CAD2_9BACT|nr:hypothetical protein [Nitritalea halalkaliphila]EIM78784.1 hypothetical protein A3SI_01971 [Nitritalea halalkaliphila LW7]